MSMSIRWFHAVNDESRLATVMKCISESNDGQVIGVECDLRCAVSTPHRGDNPTIAGIVYLSHDKISPPDVDVDAMTSLLPARELLQQLLSVGVAPNGTDRSEGPRIIIKLDFKSDDAIRNLLARDFQVIHDLQKCLYPRYEIWGNADLIRSQRFTVAHEFAEAFPEPLESCMRLFAISNVVSLGFHRPAAAVNAYDASDVDDVASFASIVVNNDGNRRQRNVRVTLALRLSLARKGGISSLEATRAMITIASANIASVVPPAATVDASSPGTTAAFVTFWRARDESITDEDADWVVKELAVPATIDLE